MKRLKLLSALLGALLFSMNLQSQIMYETEFDESVKLFNHTGYTPFYGGADHSDLGHWLAWVSSSGGVQLADGTDGRSWGWDSINPISGKRSLKADILTLGTSNQLGNVSVQTVFPLIDYTKEYVLEFNTRVEEDWRIQVELIDVFRGGTGNDLRTLYRIPKIVPKGDGKMRFVFKPGDMIAQPRDPASRTYTLHASQINIAIGGSNTGKFVMDDVVFKVYEPEQWEIANVVTGGSNIANAADLSANFSVTYDQEFMYLSFDVKDQTIVPWPGTGESYNFDNIEIFVDPANSKARRYGEGAIPAQQLRINVKADGTEPTISRGAKFFKSATQTITADGYKIEVVLSLDSLQITPTKGNEIGFDVTIGDNDATIRKAIIAWHNATGRDESWQNPAYFGTIKFVDGGEFEAVNVMPVIGEFNGIFNRADRRGIEKWTLGQDAVTGTADFSGRHYVLWDNTNLYIKVEVFDDKLVAFKGTGNTYDFDNIEIFLDMKNDKAGSYAAHHHQLRFNYDTLLITGSNVSQAMRDAIKRAQMVMKNNTGDTIGWVLETAIPWSVLGETSPSVSKRIGFDISIADNDGAGRKAIKVWNNPTGADNNWRHPFLFGVLETAGGAITRSIADTEAPTAPGNLTVSDITLTGLKLSWEPSTDNWSVFKYVVYNNDVEVGTTNFSTTTFTLSNLTAATEYNLSVKAVDVSDNASAAASVTASTLVPVGVENVDAKIRVYPNPITTEVRVDSSVALKSIKVVSITGQVILEQNVENLSGLSLNSSAWSNGIYFINIVDVDGKSWTRKMVK
jgi:hypothetical protein